MTYSSSIINESRPLVLDTSVVINLHACSYGERILATLSNTIIVPEIVAGELEHDTSRYNGERSFLHGLLDRGRVTLGKLTDRENEHFANLVSGFRSVGDGEAATIAIAANRQLLPLLDDGRARAIGAHALSGEEPGWSLDLIRHPAVTSSLGKSSAIDALYLALRNGRMRIPVGSTEYIIALLGDERAKNCTSLPDYRRRFGQFDRQGTIPAQKNISTK